MAKHTPGPWRAIPDRSHPCDVRITSSVRPHVAKVYAPSTSADEVTPANARLIAAAPDLLAALIDARRGLAAYVGLPVEQCIGGEFTEINAAIAKATGESHD